MRGAWSICRTFIALATLATWNAPTSQPAAPVVSGFLAPSAPGMFKVRSSFPHVSTLVRASFADAHYGWLSAGSRILATNNGGRTWTMQYDAMAHQQSAAYVDGVDAISPRQVWATTSLGLLHTTNGGRIWSFVNHDAPSQPFILDFLDARRGWRVSFGGEIVLQRTLDGGATWSTVASPCSTAKTVGAYRLDSAHFITSTTGWLLCIVPFGARSAALFQTRDAGRHWVMVRQDPARSLPIPSADQQVVTSHLFFLNDRDGWVSLDTRGLFSTHNGGHSWRRISVLPTLQGLDFLDARRGIGVETSPSNDVSDASTLLTTRDGGATWSAIYPPPIPVGLPSCQAHDLAADAFWQGATGSMYGGVTFSARTSAACLMRDTLQIQPLGTHGSPLPIRIIHLTRNSAPSVVVEPGQRAAISLFWSNYCGPPPSYPLRVRITLPGGNGQLSVPVRNGGVPRCDAPSYQSTLREGPVQPLDPPVTVQVDKQEG